MSEEKSHKENKPNLLEIEFGPVKEYNDPQIPTLKEASEKPELLKKMPLRWKKNAAILASVGLASPFLFSACGEHFQGTRLSQLTNYYDENESGYAYNNEFLQNYAGLGITTADLNFKLHHGGFGMAIYVVYLTEAEALGIIHRQLELAGFNFNAEPPDYVVGLVGDLEKGFDLFDSDLGVAIALFDSHKSNLPFFSRGSSLAQWVEGEFMEQVHDIEVGVFYTMLAEAGISRTRIDRMESQMADRVIEIAKENAIPCIEENLSEQIENFFASMQEKGVLADD